MARARVAAVLLTTLPGTTFLYYGEEIGMTDVAVPSMLATDANGRDPVRTPMQWDMNLVSAGFSNARPWLPTPAHGVDVASQRADPHALLNLYRRLLRLRHTHPCLRSESYEGVEAGPDVYAYRRTCGNNKLMMLLNFADAHRPVAVARDRTGTDARLILSTHRRELSTVVDPHDLVLAPNEGVIVELETKRA
jgi:alpha-glucosidase